MMVLLYTTPPLLLLFLHYNPFVTIERVPFQDSRKVEQMSI